MGAENADYSEYRGRGYRETFWGDTWLAVERDPGSGLDEFPDAIEFETGPRGSWVKLPRTTLTRRWREIVHARWYGLDVQVFRVLPDDQIVLSYFGDPDIAEALGMSGDRYSMWTIIVPSHEVEDIWVETRENPL